MTAALPIHRHGYSIDPAGTIHYDDRPMSWADADARAGRRLDRRRSWAFVGGKLCSLIRWSTACSGCCEDVQADRGGGCSECGYHGRARGAMWFPDDARGLRP
jgi:hypothetical protein